MNKDKKTLIISLAIVLVIAIGITIYLIMNKKVVTTDAIKIRDEYAQLNGKKNSRDLDYPIVSLKDNNPYVYINDEELLKLIKEGTGVIYFGFPSCPWCRSMLPVLETASLNKHNDKIYYYNIVSIRDKFEVNSNNELIKTNDGTKTYKELLSLLSNYLTDYTVTDNNGKEINTNEKRLYAPTVLTVKDGVIKDIHIGTLDSQESGYDKLTDTEIKDLTKIYENMINGVNSTTCNEEEEC